MPNRIIKESINESKGLSECSPLAQDLFKRLITYADDYGRFNPDPEIMRARLYPRELESVDEREIDDALVELCTVDKVRYYQAGSIRGQCIFGLLVGWEKHQRIRNSRAKYPVPESEFNDWFTKRAISIDLKVAIYERDDFTCQECGKQYKIEGMNTKHAIRVMNGALHIDHIVPVQQGGRATPENLRLLCARCNKSRKKRFTFEELCDLPRNDADYAQPPPIAASSGESPPESNPIQSNPIIKPMAATPPPAPEPEQTLPDEPKVKSDDKPAVVPKPKRAAPVPKPDLLVTTIPHGAELQTALDAHFAGLQNPHPAWTVFASLTQRNAYAKVAVELDGELVKLATSGLAKGAADRGRLLSWLEGCAKKRRDGTGGNHAARQSVQTKSGNPNAGRYEHKPFDPTRQRVTPVS